MRAFVLELQDATRHDLIEGVTSFVGEDASGSFGLLAGHERFMTCLVFGLARYRVGEDDWQYLALPGATLYFVDNRLRISTRRYVSHPDYEEISALLREQLLVEEAELQSTRESLRQMEKEVLHRIWQLGQAGKRP